MKRDYLKKGIHTSPGKHGIYYTYISDLSKIMATTSHLVGKVISDVDEWIVRIEGVRVPRNLVGHMNFPNGADRMRIDDLYVDLGALLDKLEKTSNLKIYIP
jgi:hypothetical protein